MAPEESKPTNKNELDLTGLELNDRTSQETVFLISFSNKDSLLSFFTANEKPGKNIEKSIGKLHYYKLVVLGIIRALAYTETSSGGQ